jgi:hypothetical protein
MHGEDFNVDTKHNSICFIPIKVVHKAQVPRAHLPDEIFYWFLVKRLLEKSLKHYTWPWHAFLEKHPHNIKIFRHLGVS